MCYINNSSFYDKKYCCISVLIHLILYYAYKQKPTYQKMSWSGCIQRILQLVQNYRQGIFDFLWNIVANLIVRKRQISNKTSSICINIHINIIQIRQIKFGKMPGLSSYSGIFNTVVFKIQIGHNPGTEIWLFGNVGVSKTSTCKKHWHRLLVLSGHHLGVNQTKHCELLCFGSYKYQKHDE